MSPEAKNKYAGIGAVLGLIAGITFGVGLASNWAGGIGQNIGPVVFLSIFGLGVGGGIGWFIGRTVQSPIIGLRLLIMAGLAVLFFILRLALNIPMVAVLLITGAVGGILLWRTSPTTEAK